MVAPRCTVVVVRLGLLGMLTPSVLAFRFLGPLSVLCKMRFVGSLGLAMVVVLFGVGPGSLSDLAVARAEETSTSPTVIAVILTTTFLDSPTGAGRLDVILDALSLALPRRPFLRLPLRVVSKWTAPRRRTLSTRRVTGGGGFKGKMRPMRKEARACSAARG